MSYVQDKYIPKALASKALKIFIGKHLDNFVFDQALPYDFRWIL